MRLLYSVIACSLALAGVGAAEPRPGPLGCNAVSAIFGPSGAPCGQAREPIEGSDPWVQWDKHGGAGDRSPQDLVEAYARQAGVASAPTMERKAIDEIWHRRDGREPAAMPGAGAVTPARPPSLLERIFGEAGDPFRTDRTIHAGRQTVRSATGQAVAQRAVLYDEDPGNPDGNRHAGSALWRTETVSPGPGAPPERAIRVDVEIHGRPLAMTMSIRRNTDTALPASHMIEIMFDLPADFEFGGVASVPGVLAKNAEQSRGAPLSGLAVKISNNLFLIGLSAVEADVERNLQLLKEQRWFDVPVVYNNGRRGIIAIEKGASGQRSFEEALARWNAPQARGTLAETETGPIPPAQSQTHAVVPPPAAQSAYVQPPLVLERVVPVNETRTIYFVSHVFPDCSSRGPVVARITEPPRSGNVSFEAGEGFSTFAQAPYTSCNDRKVEGLSVKYEPYPRYEGPDAFAGIFILPDGRVRKFEFRITVQ